MALTKEQIIEIQISADYLTRKRIRENDEAKAYKENLADKIAEAKMRKPEKEVVVEEVEVKTEAESAKDESKKGK